MELLTKQVKKNRRRRYIRAFGNTDVIGFFNNSKRGLNCQFAFCVFHNAGYDKIFCVLNECGGTCRSFPFSEGDTTRF